MTETITEISELQATARKIRRHIVKMTHVAQSGHPGGSLSSVEILTALYFGGILKHDPTRPEWSERDWFIMSKGHATPVLYATLAESGYFDVDLLDTFRQLGSPLQGHGTRGRPAGVEMSGGALGMGLSFCNGLSLATRIDNEKRRAYCLLGDGELNEGQNWEAAMAAAHFGFNQLTAIIDRNRFQNDGPGDEIMRLDPLIDKWISFGWHVIAINDGHDLNELIDAFQEAQGIQDQPQVIIAPTIKGKGVSFMEADPASWHGKGPSDEQLRLALEEIGL